MCFTPQLCLGGDILPADDNHLQQINCWFSIREVASNVFYRLIVKAIREILEIKGLLSSEDNLRTDSQLVRLFWNLSPKCEKFVFRRSVQYIHWMSFSAELRTSLVMYVCCAHVPIKGISSCLHPNRQGWLFRQIKGGSFVFRDEQRGRSECITSGQDSYLQMKATLRLDQYCAHNTVKWSILIILTTSTHTHTRKACAPLRVENNAWRICKNEYLNRYSKFTSEMSHICWELSSKLSFPFSPQPISDWHLNKASSILERIDICIAIFFLVSLHISIYKHPEMNSAPPRLPAFTVFALRYWYGQYLDPILYMFTQEWISAGGIFNILFMCLSHHCCDYSAKLRRLFLPNYTD